MVDVLYSISVKQQRPEGHSLRAHIHDEKALLILLQLRVTTPPPLWAESAHKNPSLSRKRLPHLTWDPGVKCR